MTPSEYAAQLRADATEHEKPPHPDLRIGRMIREYADAVESLDIGVPISELESLIEAWRDTNDALWSAEQDILEIIDRHTASETPIEMAVRVGPGPAEPSTHRGGLDTGEQS